jgi:hypothetical protein
MIISGGSRCNWRFFAGHLMNDRQNGYVRVAEVRGLTSDTVLDALREMDAIASGTRCKNFFYHCNINPRYGEELTPEQWEQAADTLEQNLGLTGHARFVVEHDKNGRIHRHIIWCRIDPDTMTAVSDSFTAPIHERTSRELEQAFGLEPVESVLTRDREKERPERRPRNWETFRGNSSGIDPQDVKAEITALWNASDTGTAFAAALAEHGYILCKGDRRDFCIIDAAGNEHSLARRIEGAKAASVRARMADVDRDELPSVAEGRAQADERRDASAAADTAQPDLAGAEPLSDTPAPDQMPELREQAAGLSVWERLQAYAELAVREEQTPLPWAVDELYALLRSEGSGGGQEQPASQSIDDYAAPIEQAIVQEGAIPMRDGLTWWARAAGTAQDVFSATLGWARDQWNNFVEFMEWGRDNDRDDPEQGR